VHGSLAASELTCCATNTSAGLHDLVYLVNEDNPILLRRTQRLCNNPVAVQAALYLAI
jgi:hypothetical protein